jgi:alpha-glucoside transport system permease protein
VDAQRITFLVGAVVGVPVVLVLYILVTDWLIRRLPPAQHGRVRPWLWVGPALLLVTGFLIYPGIATAWLSLLANDGKSFVGFANFGHVLADHSVLIAIRNNVLWLVFYTGLVLVFGLILAVMADRVPYEGAIKSLIFMPMAISFVAAGLIWSFMYQYQPNLPGVHQTGTLNAVWVNLLHQQPIAWIIDERVNNFALIFAAVWVWTGFSMVITSAALKGIPPELTEAARVDGATELQVFFRITVPLLAPTLTVIGTTLVIFALKAFDIIYVMTNGLYNTDVMARRMYGEMFTSQNYANSAAIAMLLLLAVIPVLIFNLRRFQFQEAIR